MKALQVETTSPAPALAARAERELSLVPQAPPGERARKLLMDAKAASLEHIEALEAALASARDLAQGVIDGGELYGPGLHEFSRTLAEDLLWRSKTLEALVERQRKAAVSK
jgi:hypothetical protein